MQFLVNLLFLFITLLVMSAGQAALALGVMYAMHRFASDKLTEKNYGEFDFDSFDKPIFINFCIRLALLFVIITLPLHLLEFIAVGRYINYPSVRWIVGIALFVIESGAITVILWRVFNLDLFRLVVLGAASALFYLILLMYLMSGNLLLP